MDRSSAGPDLQFTAQSPTRYFIREAFRRIWTSKRTSFVAIGMIAISLLIVGTFLLVSRNLSRSVEQWKGRSKVTIFLEVGASAADVARIDQELARRRHLARRRYVSSDEALLRFRRHFAHLGSVVGELDQNPFPPSFEVEVADSAIAAPDFDDQISAVRRLRQVDDVQFDWQWIAKLERLVDTINIIGLAVGGVLAIAAAFTIANVIRLTMLLYKEEIDIMRLVGATEGIIRGPFLAEGLLQGFIGGVVAVGVLYALYATVRHFIEPSTAVIADFVVGSFLPWQSCAALVGGGLLAGLIGSWLSVRGATEER